MIQRHTHTYHHTHTHTHTHVPSHTHNDTHTCTLTHAQRHTLTQAGTDVHTRMHPRTLTYTGTQTCTFSHKHTDAHAHKHTRTCPPYQSHLPRLVWWSGMRAHPSHTCALRTARVHQNPLCWNINHHTSCSKPHILSSLRVCARARMRACVRACVHVCACSGLVKLSIYSICMLLMALPLADCVLPY